jgi:hypothetical protein
MIPSLIARLRKNAGPCFFLQRHQSPDVQTSVGCPLHNIRPWSRQILFRPSSTSSISFAMPQVASPLLSVLIEARELLARPGNEFAWSKWRSMEEALEEMDRHIAIVDQGQPLEKFRLNLLFAPTGSIQEVSMSSGWSRQFMDLATRFDDVMGRG